MSSEDFAPVRRGRRARRKARRRRLLFWGAILVLLLLIVASAKPAYRWAKTRRANHFAAEAAALTRAGKMSEAAAKYRAALQLDPIGYQPLAGAARLATQAGLPEAVSLWQQLLRLPQSTVADRQEYAALLLREGTLRPAERIIERLLQTTPDAKTLSLAVQFYSKSGNDSKALQMARLAVARAPEDDGIQFQLLEILARSTDPAQQAEARTTLWSFAEKKGRLQRAAIEALARAPALSAEERPRVLALLNQLPERNVVLGLLAAELKLQMEPATAAQIYDEAIAQYGRGEAADLAELSRWLNLHKQFERVLILLPEERVLAAEPLLLSRLDALAGLEHWKEIEGLLQKPELKLDPAVTESFRARNAMGLGSSLDAGLHWEHALELAKGNAFKLRFVASFAERSGAPIPALKAYEQLSRFPEQAAFAQRGRQRLIEQKGDATAARNVAEQLMTVMPEDVNAQAQLVHLNLLLGVKLDDNLKKAKELVAKDPARLSFRVTAALGFLREHDAASALAQFQGPAPIEWSRTPPEWRAVYAAVLEANEQEEAARKIIATIPLERLNEEERALIAFAIPAP